MDLKILDFLIAGIADCNEFNEFNVESGWLLVKSCDSLHSPQYQWEFLVLLRISWITQMIATYDSNMPNILNISNKIFTPIEGNLQ